MSAQPASAAVLLVERRAFQRWFVTALLERWGYRVLAPPAAEASIAVVSASASPDELRAAGHRALARIVLVDPAQSYAPSASEIAVHYDDAPGELRLAVARALEPSQREPSVDLAALRSYTSVGGDELLVEVCGLFDADAEQRCAALVLAGAEGDRARVAREAHALEGACATVHARPATRLAAALVAASSALALDALAAHARALSDEVSRARSALAPVAKGGAR